MSWLFNNNRLDYSTCTTGNQFTFALDTAANELTYNEYLDWKPKACNHKKYYPIWHLKESYRK